MFDRKRVAPGAALLALTAAAALALSGCTSSGSANWSSSGSNTPGSSASPGSSSGPANLTVVPAASAKNVAPSNPIVVTAGGSASVTSVSVTAGSKTIAGKLSDDGKTWTSTTQLKFNTKYTVHVEATGVAPTTSTFTTVKPAKTVTSRLWTNAMIESVANNAKFGVGQPVIMHFNTSIPKSARAAVVKALQVETTPAVEGKWHWIDGQNVHYRPEKYWAAGTKIVVHANLYGVKIGSGTYLSSNETKTMNIGDSHIAIANNKTHQMKVYINGKLVKTIPVSLGRGGYVDGANGQKIDLWTRTGPHVVIQKTPYWMMSSASYGLVDKSNPLYYAPEKVYDTVRISYSGEFVHLRTWTTGDLGHRNSSHGCINVGQGNAQYMYKLLIPGDIVDVTGTPIKLPVTDGLGDWTIPWSKW
jgi:lipoprotein-anchoring transpeptidase ErfK/SrfK